MIYFKYQKTQTHLDFIHTNIMKGEMKMKKTMVNINPNKKNVNCNSNYDPKPFKTTPNNK